VALYGEVAAEMYQGVADIEGAAYYDNALRLRDMGRLLLATEVRLTQRGALNAHRINGKINWTLLLNQYRKVRPFLIYDHLLFTFVHQVRSAKTYWHVQAPDSPGVSRIYPKNYKPKVVGMMWSMLAQEQVSLMTIILIFP
jgi:hypothetical protein